MNILFIFFSALFALNVCVAAEFSKSWDLGGNLKVNFQSDIDFEYTTDDDLKLSAHIAGLHVLGLNDKNNEQSISLFINHHYRQGPVELHQENNLIDIKSSWKEKLPIDFIHLLYGAARVSWLERRIYPVHAACIGNEEDGYTLLMGAPGSGKTTLTLNAAFNQNYKVYSGDKTLLRFNENNELEAISGTRTITLRQEDVWRWSDIPIRFKPLGERVAFQLPSEYYSTEKTVQIKKIILVSLNDGVETKQLLEPLSALHTLYPFFMDKQREDILVGGDQAFFDGAVSVETRAELAKNLKLALKKIPVYKAVASLQTILTLINGEIVTKYEPKKILFGICGISNGHCSRQLPVIKHMLDQGHEVLIFTYGDGLNYFNNRLPLNARLKIIPVVNPYYIGTPKGVDFELTANSEKNNIDFTKINSLAIHQAAIEFGRADLVISDYEMVAAQYAYTKNIPLITLDQQSKYLVGDFSLMLNGTSFIDEVERLSLFFPKAKKRIAVSFFSVDKGQRKSEFNVEVISPMIRDEVLDAKGFPKSEKPTILVYVTAQQLGDQPVEDWIHTIQNALPKNYEAHLFLPQRLNLPSNEDQLYFYHHGDKKFDPLLFSCHGIITTAGHNLLSEAMYLEKPVFALPLPLYEQQLNAHIIEEGGFGLSRADLKVGDLSIFFGNLTLYSKNIANDTKYLLKEPGNKSIIDKIDRVLYEK